MKTLATIIAISLLIAGCSKQEPTDYREQFLGKWRGTWQYATPYYNQQSMYCYRHFIPGYTDNELNVNGNWRTQTVELSGSKYRYQAFEIAGAACGIMSIVTITGTGTIRNDTLTETGTLQFIVNNTTYSGTWSSKMVKD